ncbi:COG3904 family protein [Pseudomonas panipatensis]|uniref:Periplasmic protein-like protein n=1 Tax=Pseudomonas panipatensis TaxID=428992 RepID=A0A1G8KNQ7_9PSED|nr:hypothetical protein [Pseudomonas panipatensis]SDI45037.1 hypothetical protein SAMN05216272_109160 [Pseudomonas panipatensis]SMP70231.1 hypothetical protein SAMN06295951_109160 [Pseudomonas panipatensis]
MTTATVRACLLGIALLFSAMAHARVEVQAVQNKTLGQTLAVRVTEDIAPGDYQLLLEGLKKNPGKFASKVALLDSIGGSLAEAIKMGRLLREAGFDAWVPSNGVCQGTCVYLLAAGRTRQVRGYVGLHRPYFPNGDSSLADAAGGSRYSPEAYFREMDIAPSLLEDMARIEPGRMHVLSAAELTRYRLD